MRALGCKRLPTTSALLPASAYFSSAAGGGGGRGRCRGLGLGFGPGPSTPPPPPESSDPSPPPSLGHGRGRGVPSASAPAGSGSGPHLTPVFPSFLPSPSSLGRGRGARPTETPKPADPSTKRPIFFSREKPEFADPDETHAAASSGGSGPHPPPPLPTLPAAGRGKAPAIPAIKPAETNRHARPRQPIGAPAASAKSSVDPAPPAGPKLSQEDAIKKAMEVLTRGGDGTGGGRGGRGRGRGRGMAARGRGRGRGRGRDADDEFELYVGDNADGEKFVKRMGEDKMKLVEEAFEEVSSRVLPSPVEDAYLDAVHTNNMIEYEPEYLMEFDRNPDIDEKPPMSLEEVLQKAKPFLMAYEGIKSQEEWEEIIKELMERLPHMKELIDMYCGPDRVTAKQQIEELQRVAKTLPENVPSSVKRFTDRAVLSLQSNPGWGWDKKCQFMDKLVWEVSQHYK